MPKFNTYRRSRGLFKSLTLNMSNSDPCKYILEPDIESELLDVTALSVLFSDFARAVAGRPVSYAAVLRMKADSSSSSSLNSRMRLRNNHGVGSSSQDWPPFSRHRYLALSSQEDYRSEGENEAESHNPMPIHRCVVSTYKLTLTDLYSHHTGVNEFLFCF